MNEIYDVAFSKSDPKNFYACGYKWIDPTTEANSLAVTMKMSGSGNIQQLNVWGSATDQRDVCRAVAFDEKKQQVIYLLEVTSAALRPDFSKYGSFSGSNTDALMIKMTPGGYFKGAHNINFDKAGVSLGIGTGAFFTLDSKYVFGGQSYGFKTKLQEVKPDASSPTSDSFLMKYDPEDSNSANCFYTADMSSSDLKYANTAYDNNQIADRSSDSYMFKKMSNLFVAWPSKYSGSFDLSDTMRYPKMCADTSVNMTDGVEYYRGQKEADYVISEKSTEGNIALSQLDFGSQWLFQNGSSAEGYLGRWDPASAGGTLFIQTDNADAEGKQRTVLRGCSSANQLAELYLYVEVKKNTYPDFKTEIETAWTLAVGDSFSYQLPELVDAEGNDESELFIQKMPDQEYPPFLSFDNQTNTLNFEPNSVWFQGRDFYFVILVKEKNSDTVLYPYYCTVNMQGQLIFPE